ncbi:beta-1,4-galactosyltransferase 4-like isoform X2 [Narcine bancroftii]|uniref:beta-1,4-galactosyltransferase 4-like isoform X2 n=1 Tax=Narcine bancroftii TaxID=1343680 RepID=UPI0038313357
MVCKLATRIFFQRFVLLLIILSIGPVIWMLTIYKEELVWEVKTKHLMQKVLKVARQVEEWKTSISPSKISPTPKPLQLCPSLSPFLRGATDLKFDAHLTLEQVWKKNPKVQRGMFAPEKCQPIQRVAILIPYRNRERHLLYLLEHLHPFLQRQLLDYGIYVIQQAGNNVFNRAKLLNVGFLEAVKERKWDCFIFHDVDLIPENDFNLYQCDNEPKHFVVGRNSTGYKAKQQKMKLVRPDPEIARYTMIFHKRDKGNEVNKNRWNLLRNVSKQWKEDGLNSCSYNMIAEDHQPLYINITVDIGSPHHNPQVSNRNAPPVINGI